MQWNEHISRPIRITVDDREAHSQTVSILIEYKRRRSDYPMAAAWRLRC